MNDDNIIDINFGKGNIPDFIKKLAPQMGSLILIGLLLWLATGIYIVAPNEVGIVKRFGRYVRETPPGPHWHAPYPVESVLRPRVTAILREEIGFRTIDPGPPARYRAVPAEANMLTGDENILSVEFIVQYKISDPVKFLFNVRDPVDVLKNAAESSMREVIGSEKIDGVLTVGKQRIQMLTSNLLQRVIDSYEIGLQVVAVQLQDVNPPKEVISAFKDVASAREDKEKLINQAHGFENQLLPRAKGEAAQMVNKALGYKQSRISRAEGDVNRFIKTMEQYQRNKDIIGSRIYLESMQEILSRPKMVIMDGKIGKNTLPLFSLDSMINKGKK